VRDTVSTVLDLTCCDMLYIGGGNARKIAVELPAIVKPVSNSVGLAGAVRLWEPQLDGFFVEEPKARWRPAPERSS
jgi:polyphosphate glucokinase